MSKLRIVNARTAEQWAELILSKWQISLTGILETGLYLHNAREELDTAEFRKMVDERLRFSKTTVSQLIKVGTDPKLMEDVWHAKLPARWDTLYRLTLLTDEQFQRGIDTGIIHAGMERKDIAQLKPPKDKPAAEAPLTGRDLVERRTLETRKYIVATLRGFNPGEQLEFISLLRFQLDDLEARRKEAA